jgi:hypothetical protein
MVTNHPILIIVKFVELVPGSQFVRPTVCVIRKNLIGAWQVHNLRVMLSLGMYMGREHLG